MGAGAMFTLYTCVALILDKSLGGSSGFVTLALIAIGIGSTVGNASGRPAGRLADWLLDGAAIFLGLLTVVMLPLPVMVTSKSGAILPSAVGRRRFQDRLSGVDPGHARGSQAPGLASSVNVEAFNLGNALGGAVLSLGLGYRASHSPVRRFLPVVWSCCWLAEGALP